MYCSKIQSIPGHNIISVQYEDRNVIHGTRNLDNRWIVRVSPKMAFDVLIHTGIEVCNRRMKLRPYDDVLRDEYSEFLEFRQLQKKYMYDKIKSLTGVMPAQAMSIIQEAADDMLPHTDTSLMSTEKNIQNNSDTEDMDKQGLGDRVKHD